MVANVLVSDHINSTDVTHFILIQIETKVGGEWSGKHILVKLIVQPFNTTEFVMTSRKGYYRIVFAAPQTPQSSASICRLTVAD
ncbi:hypothetical protein EB796_014786 [Bugula neritina]|uniref:Uncharacterized protein n=1 Tax=Bugula neritina TaxID=10212 RepID=A0A7J7JKN4_BUGNE|nr:hypothetical protein EB796_014786 [Bugula neritina]